MALQESVSTVQGRASGQLHQAATPGVAGTDRVGTLRRPEDRPGAGGGGREKAELRATFRCLMGSTAQRVGGASQEDTKTKRETGGEEESQFSAC